MAETKFYKLKAGTHNTGISGDKKNPPRDYRWNDPKNNVVESELPLDEIYPEKFDLHKGPPPRSMDTLPDAYKPTKPPGPPTEADRAMAELASFRGPQDKKARAELLMKQARQLKQEAEREEQAQQEQMEQIEEMEKSQSARMQEAKSKRQTPPTPNMTMDDTGKDTPEEAEQGSQEQSTPSSPPPTQEQTQEEPPPIPPDQHLHRMSLDQLKQVCSQNSIQMPTEAKRVDYINTLKQARSQKEQQQG
jgi:hypothetical protein